MASKSKRQCKTLEEKGGGGVCRRRRRTKKNKRKKREKENENGSRSPSRSIVRRARWKQTTQKLACIVPDWEANRRLAPRQRKSETARELEEAMFTTGSMHTNLPGSIDDPTEKRSEPRASLLLCAYTGYENGKEETRKEHGKGTKEGEKEGKGSEPVRWTARGSIWFLNANKSTSWQKRRRRRRRAAPWCARARSAHRKPTLFRYRLMLQRNLVTDEDGLPDIFFNHPSPPRRPPLILIPFPVSPPLKVLLVLLIARDPLVCRSWCLLPRQCAPGPQTGGPRFLSGLTICRAGELPARPLSRVPSEF